MEQIRPPGSSNSFAQDSSGYALARPTYPEELLAWIAEQSPGRERLWDCATGNGQAAAGLARHFGRIEATDIAAEQVNEAPAGRRIRYSVQPAERTNFDRSSFDAVTVAQALHWFDLPRFWAEVRRVARPGAVFCAWGYAWFRYDDAVEAALVEPVKALVEPYWAPNNRLLWNGYPDAEIGCPFPRLEAPRFTLALNADAAGIAAYLRTWSAFKRAAGSDPALAAALEEAVARGLAAIGPERPVRAESPLALVAARIA